MEKQKELRKKFRELDVALHAFIRAAPEFAGDMDLSKDLGKAVANLDWAIREIETP